MNEQKRFDETEGGQPSGPGWALLGAASREKADAFLEQQAELARLQAKELGDEIHVRHWRARVEHWSGLLKLAFELTVALLALAVLVGVGAAVWDAAHDKALVIEAFSVPPDIAARGLDGQSVAAHLQDRLAVMQAATQSVRPADSYSTDWGNDIKVQIPDTGVSIGEVHRLLVAWLGHQTHISGDVWRTNKTISITTRTSSGDAVTVSGPEDDLNGLLQRAAESIYLRTQPYRYAVYLLFRGNPDWARVRAIYNDLAANGPQRERAWAYVGLSTVDSNLGDDEASLANLRQAIAILPSFGLPYQNIEGVESARGHEEAAMQAAEASLRVLPDDREMAPDLRSTQMAIMRGELDGLRDDYAAAVQDEGVAAAQTVSPRQAELARQRILIAKSLLHDGKGVQAAYRSFPPSDQPGTKINRQATLLLAQYALGDWQALNTGLPPHFVEDLTQSALASGADRRVVDNVMARQVWPFLAVAMAENGKFAQADAMVARLPLDCDLCLRARGHVAAREHRWAASAYWYGLAVQHAPSIALGYSEWGAMLLAKGDFAGAIAKFAEAKKRSPHFADPLEMWGEALILKNRSDLALAKFAEAAQYAPNWGRLHLKWGEALLWSGDKSGAIKQFAQAAGLDPTDAEKSELAKWSRS